MKKFIIGVALLSATFGFSQAPIRTKKEIKTQITYHGRLFAEGTFAENNSFIFKCAQYQGISIFKGFELTPYDTERLYQALTSREHKDRDVIDIPTLDNKLIHIEFFKSMIGHTTIFDIVDKENNSIYHIYPFSYKSYNRLFNKI